jgi:hypothetical protein
MADSNNVFTVDDIERFLAESSTPSTTSPALPHPPPVPPRSKRRPVPRLQLTINTDLSQRDFKPSTVGMTRSSPDAMPTATEPSNLAAEFGDEVWTKSESVQLKLIDFAFQFAGTQDDSPSLVKLTGVEDDQLPTSPGGPNVSADGVFVKPVAHAAGVTPTNSVLLNTTQEHEPEEPTSADSLQKTPERFYLPPEGWNSPRWNIHARDGSPKISFDAILIEPKLKKLVRKPTRYVHWTPSLEEQAADLSIEVNDDASSATWASWVTDTDRVAASDMFPSSEGSVTDQSPVASRTANSRGIPTCDRIVATEEVLALDSSLVFTDQDPIVVLPGTGPLAATSSESVNSVISIPRLGYSSHELVSKPLPPMPSPGRKWNVVHRKPLPNQPNLNLQIHNAESCSKFSRPSLSDLSCGDTPSTAGPCTPIMLPTPVDRTKVASVAPLPNKKAEMQKSSNAWHNVSRSLVARWIKGKSKMDRLTPIARRRFGVE